LDDRPGVVISSIRATEEQLVTTMNVCRPFTASRDAFVITALDLHELG
jgi:hypothetical protein